MTEFLLRSITKGKFEEWHPESFSSLASVIEQVEDFASDVDLLAVYEIHESNLAGNRLMIDVTKDVLDILADRERECEENNRERYEITASGRTRKL